jgi:nucleotide-binding universal stress UspA family protein
MNDKMKILIAYDGSEDADAALEDLTRAGLGEQAEVLVMSLADVFLPIDQETDNSAPVYVPQGIRRARQHAQDELEVARNSAKRASERIKSMFPGWQVSYEAEADSPAWALIRRADELRPDLIIMGARGVSVFGGRLILGSISQRVLYEARCSVRIARASSQPAEKPVRILIAVDNSIDSKAAVEAVCKRHWREGSEVGLLTVVDTVMAINPDPADASVVKWIEVAEEKDWDHVREVFEPLARKLRNAGLHTEVLIRRGKPADEILDEAHTWGADCIFVGAKGTRGIERLLLGSVSSAVAARADCSVEVERI